MSELLDVARVLDMLRPHEFTPLQRILLVQNGPLQIPLSAVFGRVVRVRVVNQRETNGAIHRLAHLYAGAKMVCEATSLLNITLEDGRQNVLDGKMGIGQVLKDLNIYLSFTLLDVGQEETCFWRTYEMVAPGVHCRIREVFPRALYLLEETLGTTFHEVVNNAGWDNVWSWLLEEDGNMSELRNRRSPDSRPASAGEDCGTEGHISRDSDCASNILDERGGENLVQASRH